MTDTYPIPFDEALRLKVLDSYAILDSEAEEEFSSLCDLVSRYFRVPTVLISLVDRDRQWFKCHHGSPQTETPRNLAFCNYTILGSEVFYVLDASQDPRFKDNALVTATSGIRFYAGAPLVTPTGFKIGTLCLIDTESRQSFSDQQAADLRELAANVMDKIELRRVRLTEGSAVETDAALHAIKEAHAYLSHELRAPINAMAGLAEVVRHHLSRGQTSANCQQNLQRITQIGREVCAIADQTLKCARLDLHGLDLDEETIDLNAFCSGMLDFVREPAQERDVEVRVFQAPKATLHADRVKLGQMCRNLMLNAVKFTQPGGKVEVSIVRSAGSGLEIVVSDNGSGMTRSDIVNALTPFSQIGRAGQTHESSLGIGLPLTKRLVELHGGRLTITSTPDEGTRIGLAFPAHRVGEILVDAG